MPSSILVFVPPRLALAISPPRFAAFLAAFGVAVPASTSAAPRFELARHLWPIAASPEVADAFDLLDLLACPAGAKAIADACRAAGRRLPLHLPPTDLAAVLLTRRAADPSYEAVVERALLAFARIVPRELPLELVARDPRKAADPALLTRALQALLGKRFVGAWHGVDDATGAIHVTIVRRGPARAALVARGGDAGRRARRDLAVDVIRIDVADGRVVIRCDADDPSLEIAYGKCVGAALFGDESFFGDAPAYTAKPIVLLGSEALAAKRPPGVSRVRLVDITWDDGEGATLSAHSSDALAAFERRGGAAGGYVTGSMYRLDAPVSPRPLDVAIRLPDRAHYRSARHERLARKALAALGSLTPGAVADDSFTLAPWIHAEWRWRKVFGDALFEQMAAAKILARAKTRMVGDPTIGKYGWSYVAFDLRSEPGKQYAVAMTPGLPSRDVEADEQRMWKLDPSAVARALVRDLGAEPAPLDPAVGEAALDLGVVRDPGIVLRLFAVLRSPGPAAPALAQAIVRAAGAAHPVVLLPDGRTLGGAAGVEVGLGLGELFGIERVTAKVFARVVEKKGAGVVVDAWRIAAPDTRFVVDAKTGRMWLDRCELDLPDSAARILRRLAQDQGRPVATALLAQAASPNRSDVGVVRQTIARLGGWMSEAFAKRGLVAPEDVAAIVAVVPNKGWRMTVKCEVF